MIKSVSKLTPYALLLSLTGFVFYFDKGLMIGTDNGCYLDMAYLISQKARFLVDYFDYRIPVLPLILSPVYEFGFSDFINRYIQLLLVYSFYIVTIYHISFSITRSQYKSFFAGIICFISLSSRTFDPARNICQPLFHHTLELVSVYILWKIFEDESIRNTFNKIMLPAISGILFGLAFIGRQVHVFPALLLLFYVLLHIYRNGLKLSEYAYLITVISSFVFGFVIIASTIFWYFYTPGVGFLALAKTWLIDAALSAHPAQTSLYSLLRRFFNITMGIAGRGIYGLPVFFVTLTSMTLLLGSILFFKTEKDSWIALKKFVVLNKAALTLLLIASAAAICNTFPTGTDADRYQGPIITIYMIALSIALANLGIGSRKRCIFFIAIVFIINLYVR